MVNDGARRMHKRSRAVPCATTTWCSAAVMASTRGSEPGGSEIARSRSAASMTTTSGAASGNHIAGSSRGFAIGSEGKAQAPSPGQALLFFNLGLRKKGDAGKCIRMILAIVGVTIQELLREIRIVMMSILICGRW